MLTLLLLRHAKSSWDDPELDDFDRPLAKRGTRAASAIGSFLADTGLKPGLVLCSAAVRTRATLALMLFELDDPPPEVVTSESLYLAGADAVLAELRRAGGETPTVMVVGHNPGLHALALSLSGDGDRKALADLAMKFPTGALAVITFDCASWSEIKPAGGRLERFITPRGLA
jgi:phosphohistidine phosphatase